MKTIVFKSVKLFMFLLSAVLSSFVGNARASQLHVIINPIEGSKTPDISGLSHLNTISMIPNKCFVFDIGGRQDVPTMPYGQEFDDMDSTVGIGSYASFHCLNPHYDIGGKSTSGELNGTLTLVIGGNRPVGEFINSNDIGSKSVAGVIGGVKIPTGELAVTMGSRNSHEPLLDIDVFTFDKCSSSSLGFSS